MKHLLTALLSLSLAGCLVRYVKAPQAAQNLDAIAAKAAVSAEQASADYNARKYAAEGARRVSTTPDAAPYPALSGLLSAMGAQVDKINAETGFNTERAAAMKALQGRKKLLSNTPEYKPFRKAYDGAAAGAARLNGLYAGYSELSGKAALLMREHGVAAVKPAELSAGAGPGLARLDSDLAAAEQNMDAALPGADSAARAKLTELKEILAALKARRVSLGASLLKVPAAGGEIFSGPGTPHAVLFRELGGIVADMEALAARYNAIAAGK